MKENAYEQMGGATGNRNDKVETDQTHLSRRDSGAVGRQESRWAGRRKCR